MATKPCRYRRCCSAIDGDVMMEAGHRAPLSGSQPLPMPSNERADGRAYATPFGRRLARDLGLNVSTCATPSARKHILEVLTQVSSVAGAQVDAVARPLEDVASIDAQLDVTLLGGDAIHLAAVVGKALSDRLRRLLGPEHDACAFAIVGETSLVKETLVEGVSELTAPALLARISRRDIVPSPRGGVASLQMTVGMPGRLRLPMEHGTVVQLTISRPRRDLCLLAGSIAFRDICEIQMSFRLGVLELFQAAGLIASVTDALTMIDDPSLAI